MSNRKRPAAVAVMVAVCMIPILSVVALALDGGMLFDARRAVQAAADEAALSAAIELYTNYPTMQGLDSSGAAESSAVNNASANGFNASNATVTVRRAGQVALAGRFAGTMLPAGYVEVTIDYTFKPGFSALFGASQLTVKGHAVARGAWLPLRNGVIALAPKGDATLKSNGNGRIVVNNGDVIVNSTGNSAGVTTGNAIVATTGTYITGGYSGGGFDPYPITGTAPVPDPLAYLPEPSSGSAGQINKTGKNDYTMSPGTFNQAVKFTGQDNVIMLPGVYYFTKGFDMSGQGSLTGTGVMLYNAGTGNSQGISITGQGAVNLTPMTTGIYKGITVFQKRTSDAPIKITGNGQFTVRGTIYGAGADAAIEGNGDTSVAGQVVVNTITVGGNGNTNIDYNAPDAPNTRIIQLIE